MGFWRKSPEPDVNDPLTEEERAEFERHLNRTRITSVDEQTGFFSALSALPRMVMPNEWLLVALEAMPMKRKLAKYELSIMMRLYNEVMGKSAEDPGSVVPKDAESAHVFCRLQPDGPPATRCTRSRQGGGPSGCSSGAGSRVRSGRQGSACVTYAFARSGLRHLRDRKSDGGVRGGPDTRHL